MNRISWCGLSPALTLLVDADVWKDAKEDLVASGSTLLVGTNVCRAGLYDQHDDWPHDRTIPFLWEEKAPHWSDSDVIRRGITGYMAASIAARMVYPNGRVVLAGMDLSYPDEGPTHGYDRHGRGTNAGPFPAAVHDFVALRDATRGSIGFYLAGNSLLESHGFDWFELAKSPK